MGSLSAASGSQSISIGVSSKATGITGITIGQGATTNGQSGIAIGTGAINSGTDCISIGTGATTGTNIKSIAIGAGTNASAANAVAIGTGAQSTVANTIVLGTAVYTTSIPGITNAANITLNEYQETVTSFINTGAAITPDFNAATIFQYTADQSFTFNGFLNAVAGKNATVIIKQDAIGGRTMTSTMAFSGGLKTLSTAPNAVDIIYVFYSGTTYYASLVTGYV